MSWLKVSALVLTFCAFASCAPTETEVEGKTLLKSGEGLESIPEPQDKEKGWLGYGYGAYGYPHYGYGHLAHHGYGYGHLVHHGYYGAYHPYAYGYRGYGYAHPGYYGYAPYGYGYHGYPLWR